MSEIRREIENFIATGNHDPSYRPWGDNIFRAAPIGKKALIDALIAEVALRLKAKKPSGRLPEDLSLREFTRRKVEPMVRGLFSKHEREVVLSAIENSTHFLTPENLEDILRTQTWLHTAWALANLYLLSTGETPLGDGEFQIVGLSQETDFYVSLDYFGSATEKEKFSDFVVHEAAHIFHNCKRERIGLRETRTREWLLDIDFRQRETFAYACEAYSRILELGNTQAERQALLDELERTEIPSSAHIDQATYIAALRNAVSARNGWKRILAACAPVKRPSAAIVPVTALNC